MPVLDQQIAIADGIVRVVSTEQSDGDFAIAAPQADFDSVRSSILDQPWTWLRQVHGSVVVHPRSAGEFAGATADGAITSSAGVPIAVTTADCAPVVLVGSHAVAVVHAGWRGIEAGIIAEAADQLADVGSTPVATILGPCIHPGGYEFSRPDLDRLVDHLGPEVESQTDDGRPALDVPAAVAVACRLSGWPEPAPSACTSDPRFFSHRTRADAGRLTTVAWIERP